jgi:hypothetical protein
MLEKILKLGRNLGEDEQFLAWPLGIVDRLNGQSTTGVVTRRVSSLYVPLYKLIYSPVDALAQFRRGKSWLEYIKMASGTAATVRTVHGKGMAHSDIHLKNFLAKLDSGEVVLIDLDGLIVKDFLPPQVSGTAMRTPFPLVIELLEERARGSYVAVRTAVFYQRLPRFADITEAGRLPPCSRRASGIPIVGQLAWDNKADAYRLHNMSHTPWTIIGSDSQ